MEIHVRAFLAVLSGWGRFHQRRAGACTCRLTPGSPTPCLASLL
jgi:hypothetical protein